MKALILAAGYGTRLKPYTDVVPKPLFPVAGRPLLDRIMDQLIAAGCDELIINTHHLADCIATHIRSHPRSIPVHLHYEPVILGTGGGIKQASLAWNQSPIMVVNGDICTDIDFRAVYAFHCAHAHPVTMVLHDYPRFNTVHVDGEGFVVDFDSSGGKMPDARSHARLAFTGIHVIDPDVLAPYPPDTFINIIDVYLDLIRNGGRIASFPARKHEWDDIGTPEQYRDAAMRAMAPEAFTHAYGKEERVSESIAAPCSIEKIAGDGSDRAWYRMRREERALIVADHGIQANDTLTEFDSFTYIGNFLHSRNIPTPHIHLSDRFSGLVFLDDLGDEHLQTFVRRAHDEKAVVKMYESVIDVLIAMSMTGADGFDTSLCYQTPVYDREMILTKECRYFIDAFLNGYLNLSIDFESASTEFERIIHNALATGLTGFMHRDFQSRNIMIQNGRPFVIDFQGGRMGPLQYDLASLLIDPYVNLPAELQRLLLDNCAEKVHDPHGMRSEEFIHSYKYCALTRNMQMLGAFGFLSRVKGKDQFEQYIPLAIQTLAANLDRLKNKGEDFPVLRSWVRQAAAIVKDRGRM